MKHEKIKLATTIFFSALAMGIYYIITFLLTPYITLNIGSEAYGFVSLAGNFATYAGIVTVALNSYATRYISVSYHRNKPKECRTYFSSVLYADLFLGIAILGILLICIWKLEYLLHISPDLVPQVKLLFFLVSVNFSMTTIGTAFSAIAYITNQLDKANIFKGLSYVVEAIVLLLLFRNFSPKVWYVGVGSVISTAVIMGSNYLLYRYYTPEISVSPKNFSFEAVKQLVVNGIWNSLNSLGNTLNTGLDLIITNLMLDGLIMGQLAIAKMISTLFSALFQLLAQPFQPLFLEDYSKRDSNKLLEDLKTSVKVSGMFSNLAFAGFFAFGMVYYKLWIPGQDARTLWALTVISIFGSIIEGAVYPLYYIYTLTVKNKIPCLVTIGGGVLNVAGMYFLIRWTGMGVYAVVLMTAVIMTVINLFFNPIYMAQCLHIKKSTFYPLLLRHIGSCLIMTALFYGISKAIRPTGWLGFLAAVLLCCLVGIPIHILVTGGKPKMMWKMMKGKV